MPMTSDTTARAVHNRFTNRATMKSKLTFAPAAIALIACVATATATAGLRVIGSSTTDRRLSHV
jgi:hypothetical protein